jgi:hypothetical protein
MLVSTYNLRQFIGGVGLLVLWEMACGCLSADAQPAQHTHVQGEGVMIEVVVVP